MNVEINNSEYKILIVDDVLSNVLLLRILLSNEKFQIATAMGGKEALEKVQQDLPDLILLDVMMPDIDGFEVTRQLRSMPEPYCDVSIIFLTALNGTPEIVKGFQTGANDFISKPFSKEELIIRVKHQISLIAANRIIVQQTEALRNSIYSRDKMYSVIAHDLRSPMGSIKMMLNMLVLTIEKKAIGGEMYEMLSLANKTTEETFSLLDNLLKWTKSQTGRLNVVYQQTEVISLVNGVLEIFSKLAELKQVELKTEFPEACDIYADRDMIKSVLRNLLSNAIKFSKPGGTVIVRIMDHVSEEGGKVVVSVEDNGLGMNEEAQKKLLKIETHFSTFGTNNEEGSGLGLLLCQDFVIKNGGRLWFTSQEGVGTIFNFSIPKR
ncbi:MAG: hybrid sensor histidine kinase/response regulator [Bacteroidales bacterium]|nr:hybrid sensor histidine kinase/response regulator [Bacteroidales bacterium]